MGVEADPPSSLPSVTIPEPGFSATCFWSHNSILTGIHHDVDLLAKIRALSICAEFVGMMCNGNPVWGGCVKVAGCAAYPMPVGC